MNDDPKLIRLLVADDHPLLRHGITTLVNAEADMKMIAEACNGEEAFQKFQLHRPDVTLMDLQMPKLDGVGAICRIVEEFPDSKIIVLTTYTGDAKALRALRSGARGYVLKSQVHRELLEVIRAVHLGQKRIPAEIAAEFAGHALDEELSARQVQILRLIAEGQANKNIAEFLRIGEATVKSHITGILSKLGANDRTHAVTIALKRGIIDLQNS